MKVLVFFAEGFEEIEAFSIIDILRRADIDAKMVSITNSREVVGAHGVPVICDELLEQVSFDEAEALVLPGGLPGATNLDACVPLGQQLKAFHKAGKTVAAICAAPIVFGHQGILEGKKATCYPGCEGELKGATVTSEGTVIDGNVITGKGPAFAAEFSLALVRHFKGKEMETELRQGMLYS